MSTVLWGRLYCGRICAYGALTQLLDTVVPAKLRREPPPWLEQRAGYVKYGLLAAVVVYFLATRDISIYRYVEPFWMFTGHGHDGDVDRSRRSCWSATVFVRNLYCRFLCPVGAFLGAVVRPDGVSHQALVRVQELQDLREDLRVGRDSRTGDREVGMRAMR